VLFSLQTSWNCPQIHAFNYRNALNEITRVFIVGLFYWLNYVNKNVTISGTSYFQDYQKIYWKNIYQERKELNNARYAEYLLEKERKYFEGFTKSAKSVSLQPVRMTRNSVRMPVTESQCSIPVWTVHRTWTIESSYSLLVRMTQWTRTTESTCLQGCLDVKVKTADGEAFPCDNPNTRSSRPDALQQNIKIADTCRDA